MNFKSLLHRNTVARYNYASKFQKTGVTFDEYSRYLYKGIRDNVTEFATSNIYGVEINRVGTYSFVQNVEEVLVDEIYKFEADTDSPYIIDCGVNIGLSVIYFKRLYPKSRVVGFEPDLKMYDVCCKNLNKFKFSGVTIHNAAVWKEDGELSFLPDESLGGMVVDENVDNVSVHKVKSLRLKSYLRETIDLLKIDIEGAELEVLEDCKYDLGNVKMMFVEYHSHINQQQELDKLLKIITNGGFRYYIKSAWDYMKHPFVEFKHYNSKNANHDVQLNIFAYRK